MGLRDTAEQLEACKQQSIRDENRILELEQALSGARRVDDLILVFAFRYALGRMTYAVGVVADELIRRASTLKPDDRDQLIREIDAADQLQQLGMSFDAATWRRVRSHLQAVDA